MYSSLRLRMARGGRYLEFGGHLLLGGGINVQYEGQNTPVPELVSAIWSESTMGGSPLSEVLLYMQYRSTLSTCPDLE